MNGRRGTLLAFAAGCLLGAAAVWACRPAAPVVTAGGGRDLGTIRELRRRIGELERRQVAAPATNAAVAAQAVTNGADYAAIEKFVRENPDGTLKLAIGDGLRSAEFREELARMKTECPALHAAIAGAIDAHIDRTVSAAMRRVEALSVFDPVMTDPGDSDRHQELKELATRIGTYQMSLNAYEGEVPGASDRKVDTLMAGLTSDAVSDLLGEERTALLGKVASELGCEGEDAAAVVETINAIIEATSPNAAADNVSLIDSIGLSVAPSAAE